MEWWNNGMSKIPPLSELIFRRRYSLIDFLVKRDFTDKAVFHFSSSHYSIIPIVSKVN